MSPEKAGDQASGRTPEQAAQDERGLRLLHGVRALRGLTPEQVGRIASRLDAAVVPARRRSLLPVLAAIAVVLLAGTAVAWATGTLRRLPELRALFTSTPDAHRSPSPVKARAAAQPSAIARPKQAAPTAGLEDLEAPKAPVNERAPVSEASPAVVPPAARKRASNVQVAVVTPEERVTPRASSNAAAALPPPPDNPIAREGESFANVLRTWRRDHDGPTALSALDLHDRRFAPGQMALESRLLRVEILLSERRDRDALALLDRLALGTKSVPRGRELLTVRGELRIKAGRCEDGRADLASIGGGSDGFAERARNALTHCR